jgi:hypothetical protein
MVLLAFAAVSLAVGGCLGPAGLGLTATGVALSASGLLLLGIWIAFCRDCTLMRFLQRFFGAMALLMAALAAAFAIIGMFPCSAGAAAVATLFGLMVAELSIGIAILGCP